MVDLAALDVSASTTPTPCVPSSSLMMTGGPFTILINSLTCAGFLAKTVLGMRTPAWAKICIERSLSRERVMACDLTVV